jgi:hypothetical protein
LKTVTKRYHRIALSNLQRIVEGFNEDMLGLSKFAIMPPDYTLTWGFETATGKKKLRVGACSTLQGGEDTEEDYKQFMNALEHEALIFSQAYWKWTQDCDCEASFHIVKDKELRFKRIEISAINIAVYRSEESTKAHLHKLMEDAKEEHKEEKPSG